MNKELVSIILNKFKDYTDEDLGNILAILKELNSHTGWKLIEGLLKELKEYTVEQIKTASPEELQKYQIILLSLDFLKGLPKELVENLEIMLDNRKIMPEQDFGYAE